MMKVKEEREFDEEERYKKEKKIHESMGIIVCSP
jgi:hypothetical protein